MQNVNTQTLLTPSHQQSMEINKNNNPGFIFNLPDDIIVSIFTSLGLQLKDCTAICKKWYLLTTQATEKTRQLWLTIFNNISMSRQRTLNWDGRFCSFDDSDSQKYWFIADYCSGCHKFGLALAAADKCESLDPTKGALAFGSIIRAALWIKDYKLAEQCQQLANKYSPNEGSLIFREGDNEIKKHILSKIKHQDFLEVSDKLISLSLALIDNDDSSGFGLWLGLESLMTIALQFAKLQKFEEAMKYTQLARTLRDAKAPQKKRSQNYIKLFNQMGLRLLSLKQYKLAEECAKSGEPQLIYPDYLYAKIIIGQIRDENYVNETLLDQLRFNNNIYIETSTKNNDEALSACREAVFALIDQGKYKEAKKYAEICLQKDRVERRKIEFFTSLVELALEAEANETIPLLIEDMLLRIENMLSRFDDMSLTSSSEDNSELIEPEV
jgi:hypothetical protein